jgi:ubiquinone/menaquinone biosynthesis C-methylase UbiE
VFLRENEEGGKLAPWFEPGQTLLDLGGGTGFLSRWLRERTGVVPTLADVVPYDNRDRSMPFLKLDDPFRVPAADGSFDVVMLLFVFHHVAGFPDQERVLDETVRVARERVVVMEDTPETGFDRAMNVAWDWLLNIRHGVPTPFTFRRADEWVELFKARDLAIVHTETYRPMWPTLKTYPHTLFVLDK